MLLMGERSQDLPSCKLERQLQHRTRITLEELGVHSKESLEKPFPFLQQINYQFSDFAKALFLFMAVGFSCFGIPPGGSPGPTGGPQGLPGMVSEAPGKFILKMYYYF